MRIVKTPPSLKWLINKRARLAGEINHLEESLPSRIEKSKLTLDEAAFRYNLSKLYHNNNVTLSQDVLPKLKDQLAAIDIALGLHEIQIDTSLIGPIRPSKRNPLPRGLITRGIYQCLKKTRHPTTTKEIALFITSKHKVGTDVLSFVELTRIVAKRLKALTTQGKIRRLHDIKTAREGIWMMPSINQ